MSAGASPSSGEVVPLRRPRTYLEAAREQGVHQQHEELIAETADLRALVARQKAARGEDVPTAEITAFADHSADGAFLARSLADQREAIVGRFKGICDAYAEAGFGDGCFPLLRHLLFNAPLRADEAPGVFTATASDTRRAPAEDPTPQSPTDNEHHRLNGEGLSARPYREDPS